MYVRRARREKQRLRGGDAAGRWRLVLLLLDLGCDGHGGRSSFHKSQLLGRLELGDDTGESLRAECLQTMTHIAALQRYKRQQLCNRPPPSGGVSHLTH